MNNVWKSTENPEGKKREGSGASPQTTALPLLHSGFLCLNSWVKEMTGIIDGSGHNSYWILKKLKLSNTRWPRDPAVQETTKGSPQRSSSTWTTPFFSCTQIRLHLVESISLNRDNCDREDSHRLLQLKRGR